SSPEDRAKYEKRKGLADVNEAACKFFEHCLRLPEGKTALEYLQKRGLDDAVIKRFRLGFAPDSRGRLKSELTRDGITEVLMLEAGLLRQPEQGETYDWFRGRVIFPIEDRQDRVIGFGGRVLGQGEPKYLNSPETPLFQKRYSLYALNHAGGPARKTGRVIVCEGYMDVIGLYRDGIDNAVAPLGTALTDEQLLELWRVAPEPVLCFDGDAAGQGAAARAAHRALPLMKAGHGLRFAILPAGEDPDSLVASKGRAAFDAVVDAALPLSEVLWRQVTGGRMPRTPEDRAGVQKQLDGLARDIADPTFRKHFADYFARKLWGDGTAGRSTPQGAGRGKGRGGWKSRPPGKLEGAVTADARAETQALPTPDIIRHWVLIASLINYPGMFDQIEEPLGMVEFSVPELDKLRARTLNTLAERADLDSAALKDHLTSEGFGALLRSLLSNETYMHARFARPGGSVDDALRGWTDTFREITTTAIRTEVLKAEADLGRDTTTATMGRMKALKTT
ncbi:MAG: DNA primase, partial [Proteobacteria bacterium]|nr:DNA primase [Pseudomonadota bacterium]